MTFRAELRDALNDVVPAHATPGLRERVLHTALAHKRRPRKERMVYRLRIPYALAAAVLIVAVIAAGALTLNSLRSAAPAAHVGSNSLQQLESRPLNFPILNSGGDMGRTIGCLRQTAGWGGLGRLRLARHVG